MNSYGLPCHAFSTSCLAVPWQRVSAPWITLPLQRRAAQSTPRLAVADPRQASQPPCFTWTHLALAPRIFTRPSLYRTSPRLALAIRSKALPQRSRTALCNSFALIGVVNSGSLPLVAVATLYYSTAARFRAMLRLRFAGKCQAMPSHSLRNLIEPSAVDRDTGVRSLRSADRYSGQKGGDDQGAIGDILTTHPLDNVLDPVA